MFAMLLCTPPKKGLIVLVKIIEVIRLKVEVEFLVQMMLFFGCISAYYGSVRTACFTVHNRSNCWDVINLDICTHAHAPIHIP